MTYYLKAEFLRNFILQYNNKPLGMLQFGNWIGDYAEFQLNNDIYSFERRRNYTNTKDLFKNEQKIGFISFDLFGVININFFGVDNNIQSIQLKPKKIFSNQYTLSTEHGELILTMEAESSWFTTNYKIELVNLNLPNLDYLIEMEAILGLCSYGLAIYPRTKPLTLFSYD